MKSVAPISCLLAVNVFLASQIDRPVTLVVMYCQNFGLGLNTMRPWPWSCGLSVLVVSLMATA